MLLKLLLILSVVCLSGCSFIAASEQVISIRTNHPDTRIYIDGREAGRGNTQRPLNTGTGHFIRINLADHNQRKSIECQLSESGVIDIVLGIVVSPLFFLGLFADGAYELQPTTVTFSIPKEYLECEETKEKKLDVVIKQLADSNPQARLQAIKKLGALGEASKQAIPHLRHLLDDADLDVRNAAKLFLEKLEESE